MLLIRKEWFPVKSCRSRQAPYSLTLGFASLTLRPHISKINRQENMRTAVCFLNLEQDMQSTNSQTGLANSIRNSVAMAKVIEFYIPKDFRKPLKGPPGFQRGKILEFCAQKKKASLAWALWTTDMNLAEVAAIENRDGDFPFTGVVPSNDTMKADTYAEDQINPIPGFAGIVGQSSALREVLHQVEMVAGTDSTVLLLGETGTGKELIARAIHDRSRRKSRLLVRVNCAAIPDGLLGSELLGHERGAFTGAITQKIGRFEVADQGSLFLDEIGDIPLELQPEILRVLREREFARLGSTVTRKVNVRVIAATHRNLEEMIHEKQFRSDLYYGLNVFPIYVPPLRERPEDIPLLARHFVQEFARRMNKTVEAISTETMDSLALYPWLGNVRELKNVIERALVIHQKGTLSIKKCILSGQPFHRSPLRQSFRRSATEDRRMSDSALAEAGGRVSGPSGAAAMLGNSPHPRWSQRSERSERSDR
jgi:transcriptional regulator with PAS, ATPase and Fis domain